MKKGREEGIEQGMKKGREVGRKEGIEVGREESSIQMAIRMLEDGMKIAKVCELTGLPERELIQLQKRVLEFLSKTKVFPMYNLKKEHL